MAEQVYGQFQDIEGPHGYTREDIAAMTREEQVRMMVDWFHAYFEDPAERTPYESREGGYQWIWGGPHNADDEVHEEFSGAVEFEVMQEAVREIERDGHEWAPKERPGDYEPIDYDDAVQSGEIVDGDDEDWPPVIRVEEPLSESEARQEVVGRLDALEELIRPLVSKHGMMGHNQPPEALEVEPPCTPEEWQTLKEDVDSLRLQTQQDAPDEQEITRASKRMGELRRKALTWLGKRAEKGIDAVIITTGATVAVNLDAVVNGMGELLNAVAKWVQSLPIPF